MIRSTPRGDSALVVVNGLLDVAEVVLARGPGERWELAWDSTWDHPDELRGAAIQGLVPAAALLLIALA